jgi:hypothetical protein
MGRYYDGDIQGKFAFGVQDSMAANRFGVRGEAPNYVDYYFCEDNIEDLESELKEMEKWFGEYEKPIMTYHDLFGCDDKPIPLEKYLLEGGYESMNENQWAEYYDYHLGRKILECIKAKGDCSFTAELG